MIKASSQLELTLNLGLSVRISWKTHPTYGNDFHAQRNTTTCASLLWKLLWNNAASIELQVEMFRNSKIFGKQLFPHNSGHTHTIFNSASVLFHISPHRRVKSTLILIFKGKFDAHM